MTLPAVWLLACLASPAAAAQPNVIVILCDDLGYGDLGCYGARHTSTPRLDRMAAEGMRFTDFYAAAPMCTPSRAALLTGCYPLRVGLPQVIDHRARIGIHADEITLAELLRSHGYATGCFGKWHLGHLPSFLPARHGFDESWGLPYSSDMWPRHPRARPGSYPHLPVFENERLVARDPDQRTLTATTTQKALDFIEGHRAGPFFLYIPFNMPHVPLFAGREHEGKSGKGLFADVIAELDASTGRILDAVRAAGIAERTLVIFTSDNGPWRQYGEEAGSPGPLRFGKGSTWEGGQRVPCLAWWPGRVPASAVCREVATGLDVFPTVSRLAGAPLPADRRLDGHDIGDLLEGRPGARSPTDAFFYYRAEALEAVRAGRWKLHAVRAGYDHETFPAAWGAPASKAPDSWPRRLYDLDADPGELSDVAAAHPDVVARLEALLEAAREDLGDGRRRGKACRPAGRADAEWRDAMAREPRLVVRLEGVGATEGSVAALDAALEGGIATCASLVVPGPSFEGAAEAARKRTAVSWGVQLVLARDAGDSWRPVLPREHVPSLVDRDGLLHPGAAALFARRPPLAEIERELRAQLALARERQVPVRHLDVRGVRLAEEPYQGLRELVERLARELDVPVLGARGERPFAPPPGVAAAALRALEPGLWRWDVAPDPWVEPDLIEAIRARGILLLAGPGA